MSLQRVALPTSTFIAGLVGAIASGVYTISGRLDLTWGFLLTLFFIILFIASVVSITPENPSKKKRKRYIK